VGHIDMASRQNIKRVNAVQSVENSVKEHFESIYKLCTQYESGDMLAEVLSKVEIARLSYVKMVEELRSTRNMVSDDDNDRH
jgi:hypothetical protein